MSSSDRQSLDDESQENDSSEETDTGSEKESGDDIKEAEKPEKPPHLVVSKPPLEPTAQIAPKNTVKSIGYDRMVYEAMKNLNENRRLGVSIQRILKYMQENYDLPSKRIKFFLKRSIDKGLKDNIYVHTSGTGLQGSIAFSTAHWNDLKKEKRKVLRAAEKKETAKRKLETKKNVEPLSTAVIKLKVDTKTKKTQSAKDKNNNATDGKAASKKAKMAVKALPMAKAKPKQKTKPNRDKPSAEIMESVVPNTKSKPSDRATRSKS